MLQKPAAATLETRAVQWSGGRGKKHLGRFALCEKVTVVHLNGWLLQLRQAQRQRILVHKTADRAVSAWVWARALPVRLEGRAPPGVNHDCIFLGTLQPLNAVAQVARLEQLNLNAHALRVRANARLDIRQRAAGAAMHRVSNRARISH
jgi:hypothetical protein